MFLFMNTWNVKALLPTSNLMWSTLTHPSEEAVGLTACCACDKLSLPPFEEPRPSRVMMDGTAGRRLPPRRSATAPPGPAMGERVAARQQHTAPTPPVGVGRAVNF